MEANQSTRLKRRLDIGRVMINVSSPQAINRSVRIKIKNESYDIIILEEPFSEDYVYMKSDRNLWNSEDSSSDEYMLVKNTLENFDIVPETLFSSSFRGDKLEEAFQDLENFNFEYMDRLEEAVLGIARQLQTLQEKGGESCSKVIQKEKVTETLSENGGSKGGDVSTNNTTAGLEMVVGLKGLNFSPIGLRAGPNQKEPNKDKGCEVLEDGELDGFRKMEMRILGPKHIEELELP